VRRGTEKGKEVYLSKERGSVKYEGEVYWNMVVVLERRRAWKHIRVSSRSTMSRTTDSHEQIDIEVGYIKW
jgi:hypothetical protein